MDTSNAERFAVLQGGLRPNTVILGFYDQTLPEDQLRSRHFLKRRWLKSNASSSFFNPMATTSNAHSSPIHSDDHYTVFRFAGAHPSVRLERQCNAFLFSSSSSSPRATPRERRQTTGRVFLRRTHPRCTSSESKCLSSETFSSLAQSRDRIERPESVR